MHVRRTQRRFVMTAAAPKVLTAFCVWPDGKEYPVAAARALSTIVRLSTHQKRMNAASMNAISSPK